MKTRYIYILLTFFATQLAWGQNNFSIKWNNYTTGDTVSDNPFLGGFTIVNVGTSTIDIGDTLHYGYSIDAESYDIALNYDLVSGTVLTEEFKPNDSLNIFNNFTWTLLGGSEIEFCAIVYGINSVSYEDVWFAGDDSIEDNSDCLRVLIPATASISEATLNEAEQFKINNNNGNLVVDFKNTNAPLESVLQISDLTGKTVFMDKVILQPGTNLFNTSPYTKGIYIVNIISSEKRYSTKVIIE